ncbi:MAG: hypothetical protein WDO13_11680 [Verrucomicrobiota bacterium]
MVGITPMRMSPLHALGKRAGCLPHRVDAAQDFARVAVDALAQRRKRRARAAALQQRLAHLLLQLLDLVAERGLGHVALPGRGGEAAAVGHGDEVSELVEFHRRHLSVG